MLRRKSGLVIAGLGALALSACGEKTETTKTATATTTAATTTAEAGGPLDPNAPPKRKPGLWQQTISSGGTVAMASKVCLDAATDAQMSIAGAQASKNACPGAKTARAADGGYTIDATCNMGSGGTVATHAVMKGDFNNAYEVDVNSTTTGAAAPQMNRSDKIKIMAKWLGPCPAGMQPGDMQMANGMTINMTGFDPAKARAMAKEAAGQ